MGITDSETIGLDSSTTGLAVLPTCCVGDTLSERYRLDREIGRGGMGIVFRAWDLELERPVAVKVMAAHLEGGDARDRLFREARAAAALSDDDAATNDLDIAVENLEKLGSRIELGRTLVLRGGGDDLERARDLFQSCGAEGDLARLDG